MCKRRNRKARFRIRALDEGGVGLIEVGFNVQ